MRRLRSLLFAPTARRLFIAVCAIGAILITRSSLPYFDAEDLHPFVLEKLPLPLEDVWLAALNVHVVAAAFALPACLLLLSRTLLRRLPRVHRHLGRVTGCVLLTALVPTGAYLALFAKGGLPGTLGFLASAVIVAVAMVRAIVGARARDFVAHRRGILHTVAQLSVAVTSRAMLVGLDTAGVDPDTAYLVALWLPVVASAWLAQTIAAGPSPPATARRNDENARLHRGLLDPARQRSGLGDAALG